TPGSDHACGVGDDVSGIFEEENAMRTISHWIDAGPVSEPADNYGPVYDPATGEQTGRVALAGAGVVAAAVRTATRAYDEWRAASLARRTKVLFAFRELVDRHRDDLAATITAEHGKTLEDAHGEVQRGLEVVEFACGIPRLSQGRYSENVST